MRNSIYIALGGVLMLASQGEAADWLLSPSSYTHNPQTGRRVAQYAAEEVPYAYVDPTYQKSGFRYTESQRRGSNGSAERLHIVEEWGRPVRPYEEWKYPYRPYSVPYQEWGAPYGGLTPYFGPDVPYTGERNDRRRRGPRPELYRDGDHREEEAEPHHGDSERRADTGGYGRPGYPYSPYQPYPPDPPYPAYLGR